MSYLVPRTTPGQQYDDAGALRRSRSSSIIAFVVTLLVGLVLLSALLGATVSAEWGRAFGADQKMTGTVVTIQPNGTVTRVCNMSRVVMTWTDDGARRSGYFEVCPNDTRKYPLGSKATGWAPAVTAGEGLVGVNLESRAEAIYGVVLDSLAILGFLAVMFGFARMVWRLGRARHRLASSPAVLMRIAEVQYTLPNGRAVRNATRLILHSLAPGAADAAQRLSLIVRDRRDHVSLHAGDAVLVVSTGRTLFRRRPTGPVAVLRDRDHTMFWGLNRVRRDRWATRHA